MCAYRHFFFRSWLMLTTVWAITGFTRSVRAADVEPYEAHVATPRAQVRSGPGERFYPTDTLTSGELVEVYREEKGGWLAIRPPERSFSLVLKRQLKLRDDGLAEVAEANVASRIGSRLNHKRNAVQVQLEKGEVVEVLGELMVDGTTWCKIAPPAGEFRWLHANNVQRVGPLANAEGEEEPETEVVTASASTESPALDPKPAGDELPPPTVEPKPAEGDEWRSTGTTAHRAAVGEEAPAATAPAAEPDAAVPTVGSGTAPAAAALPPARDITPIGTTSADDVQRQLTGIEIRLSRMAAAPPHLWNTERLARDAEELLAQAPTEAERNAVKVTLAKIDQFAALGRQYQQAAGGRGLPTGGTNPYAAPVVGNGAVAEAGRYDAVGVLRPVVSKRPGAPQFALVDERGQVVTFVTPTPDVNLQPYLGRRVGIAGTRGFMPEFNRAHVTAGRVAPLGQAIVR